MSYPRPGAILLGRGLFSPSLLADDKVPLQNWTAPPLLDALGGLSRSVGEHGGAEVLRHRAQARDGRNGHAPSLRGDRVVALGGYARHERLPVALRPAAYRRWEAAELRNRGTLRNSGSRCGARDGVFLSTVI